MKRHSSCFTQLQSFLSKQPFVFAGASVGDAPLRTFLRIPQIVAFAKATETGHLQDEAFPIRPSTWSKTLEGDLSVRSVLADTQVECSNENRRFRVFQTVHTLAS